MVIGLKKTSIFGGLALSVFAVLIGVINAAAAEVKPGGDFALNVSPSPLVATIKPGESKQLELRIQNSGTGTERLSIKPRAFTVDKKTKEVRLEETAPALIKDWINFSEPTFTVEPGKVFTQKISINLPKDSGFSYSFALLISRAGKDEAPKSGASLRGSVAVFSLINVDRPGATRKFDVSDFKTSQAVYEYLPANFEISFLNTGNTIIQPAGNVFIQRGSNDSKPITTIPVNPGAGYLLPDAPRTLTTEWSDGFPSYRTVTGADGKPKQELKWDWSKLSDFRIGRYTAKLVAVYNDGHRDVPVEKDITFWVIPWRLILGFIVIAAVFIVGLWTIVKRARKVTRRRKKSDQ